MGDTWLKPTSPSSPWKVTRPHGSAGTVRRSRGRIKVAAGAKGFYRLLVMVFEVAGAAPPLLPRRFSLLLPRGCCSVAAGAKDVNVPDIGGDEVEVTGIARSPWVTRLKPTSPLITVEGDKASMEDACAVRRCGQEIKGEGG